ncbi:hypothetical protein GOP47_0027300 [Adiantum capillus-veneris]|nr:hypothetical protein GOP47_0027300 [Adiantum capillus-veneris]
MDAISATVAPEDFIDIAADLVNVMVDKSIFNESAGSRRQTYDRDRLPRNKERRLSSGQLKISERGDRALYQPQQTAPPSGVIFEGNRSMSLKRMARASASLAGRADGTMVPLSKAAAEVLVNGKELATEVLHRSSKKMKTKEEARRRAAEAQARVTESQEDKHALLAVKISSLSHVEPVPPKDTPAGSTTSSAQIRNDLRSPDAGRAGVIGHALEASEPSNFAGGTLMERPSKRMKLLCSTCEKSFVNSYTLRRHTASTGHVLDTRMLKTGIVRKIKKAILNKSTLRCSCGNTYATPYTLRRHAVTTGHSLKLTSTSQATTPAGDLHQTVVEGEEMDGNAGLVPAKRKLGAPLPEHAWESGIKRYTCRQCDQQFSRKKQFIRHMRSHLPRKKKHGKTGHILLGAQLSGAVKVRLGRPPKHDRGLNIKQEKVRRKRKREPASPDRQVRSRKAEQSSRRTPGYIPAQKAQNLTCQECGKIFDEFSRYTGHLSMHARLRRVLVGETSSAASATVRKNMLNVKEVSALGFRKLLNDKTGTYLSGLPAKLLFSESHLAKKQKGKI